METQDLCSKCRLEEPWACDPDDLDLGDLELHDSTPEINDKTTDKNAGNE
jgi:hypothetical protein